MIAEAQKNTLGVVVFWDEGIFINGSYHCTKLKALQRGPKVSNCFIP